MALEVSEIKVQNKIIVGTQELTSAVTSVSGTGTVAGLTLSGTVTTTGNLTLGGTLSTPISTINDSTTVGQNLVKLADPSAIRFIRINANNTVDALTDANFRTAIGAGTGSGTVTGVTGTAPIVSSGGTAPAISISAATQSAAGSMSSADKTKLDGIATGATANTGTVTSVGITAGTGISVSGSPVTGSGSITVTNSSPDQTVALTGAGNVSITGTYPNFTITGSSSGSGTVTSVGLAMPTGFTVTNSPVTTTGTLTAALSSGYSLLDSNSAQTIAGSKTFSSALTVSSTSSASAIIGGIQSSWGGNVNYPTLYGSSATRWIMHINPHVSYVVNGTNGYTGDMTGSTIRMAAEPAATNYWDVGVGNSTVGTDKFSIGRNNSSLIAVDNSGSVGIGTTSPQAKLHVSGTAGTWGAGIQIEGTGTGARRYGAYVTSAGTLEFTDENAAQARMAITSGGNIGIGTTSTITKLQVHGSAWVGNEGSGVAGSQTGALYLGGSFNSNQLWYSASLRVTNTDSVPSTWKPRLGFFTQNTGEHLNTNQTERLSILSDSGNVGIGTTTPNAKLDVDGGVDVRGNLRLTGSATTTNQSRTIEFTGFDKEGTTDFSDNAYIRHTVNSGGLTGSVLEISSQNDAQDGINFITPTVDSFRHNGNIIITGANIGSQSVSSSPIQTASTTSNNFNTSFQDTPAHTNTMREMSAGGPSGTWWFVDNYRHSNSSNLWGTQFAYGWEDNANRLLQRNITGGNFGSWVEYLNSANYNGYAPTLTGGNASGTWGINITGNSATATGLPTLYYGGQQLNPQTYFGQGVGLRVAMTGAAGVWADTLWINGYSGGDVLQMVALHTRRNGEPRVYASAQASNSSSYGTMYEFLTSFNRGEYAAAVNSTSTASGGLKVRLSGTTLFITNNGNNA
jgi:hypothetical protein